MHQTKWFKNERNLQVGDVVLFTKVESSISKSYTYGIISNVEIGADGNVRRVTVRYKNANENVQRETTRFVPNLILIHAVDDCDAMKQSGEMAQRVDIEMKSKC